MRRQWSGGPNQEKQERQREEDEEEEERMRLSDWKDRLELVARWGTRGQYDLMRMRRSDRRKETRQTERGRVE